MELCKPSLLLKAKLIVLYCLSRGKDQERDHVALQHHRLC